ncbi:hypothetical protein KKG45_04420 [bacterium]|nr:hypothetical protein [bacterium]MBU1072472.1 hypothetical protein [bacterium]MBU1675997.1 hypothetical protein [bacterium]
MEAMASVGNSHVAKLSRKKRFLYSVTLVVIPVLALELGLRAVFAYHEGSSILFYGTSFYRNQMNGDPHLETMNHREAYWKYYPHQQRYTRDKETGKRISITINNHGFRGEDFSVQKPPHTIRIITLGASSTFGFSDRDEETYPCYMEQMLNSQCDGADRYEVINLGIPHLKSDQILALFLGEGLALQPDVVTFYEGVNDSWDSPVRWRVLKNSVPGIRNRARRFPIPHRFYLVLRDHFMVILLADQLFRNRDMRFTDDDFEAHAKGKSDYFVQNLAGIRKACLQNDILFIVASQQAKSFIVDRDDIRGMTYEQEGGIVGRKLAREHHITDHELYFLTHTKIMQAEAEWARANAVHYVDIIRTLDQRRDVLLSWVHLSAEGNRLVAEALTSEIMELMCQEADTLNRKTHGSQLP